MDRARRPNCSRGCHGGHDATGAVTAIGGFATLAQFDAEIERTSDHLLDLKRRRNPLVPVFRLPPEILTEIFHIVTTAKAFEIVRVEPVSLSFSRVCRAWRELALNCPTLWTRLPMRRPTLVPELLLRSKTLPLTILAEINDDGLIPALTRTLAQCSHRTEGLQLTRVNESDLDYLYINIKENIPALKHLELERLVGDISDYDDWNGPPILEEILERSASNLLRLFLHGYRVPLAQLPFPHLTRLFLEGRSLLRPGYWKLIDLLKFLRQAPALAHVHLAWIVEDEDDIPDEDLGPGVTLAQLRHLHILNQPKGMARLLDHICIPPEACISLQAGKYGDPIDATMFVDAAARACRAVGAGAIRYLAVERRHVPLLFAFEIAITGWALSPEGAPRPAVRLTCAQLRPGDCIHENRCKQAVARLHLEAVHSLRLPGEYSPEMALFLALPRLVRIRLDGACAWAVVGPRPRVLGGTGGGAVDDDGTVSKMLDTLVLTGASLGQLAPQSLIEAEPRLAETKNILRSSLLSFIQRSREGGAPLCTLVLDNLEQVPHGLSQLFMEPEQELSEINEHLREFDRADVGQAEEKEKRSWLGLGDHFDEKFWWYGFEEH